MNIRAIILGVLLAPFVSCALPTKTNSINVKVSEHTEVRYSVAQGETCVFVAKFRERNEIPSLANMTAEYLYRPVGSNSWWTIPTTIDTATGTVSFSWDYTRDAGFRSYEGWLWLRNADLSTYYRLKLDIGMILTPGFIPNVSEFQKSGIDFASIPYTNAPWATIVSMLASDVLVRAEMRTAMGQTGDVVKSYGASQLAAHVIASDPHGDRAAASAADSVAIGAHSIAADPHGDRAYAAATAASVAGATGVVVLASANSTLVLSGGVWRLEWTALVNASNVLQSVALTNEAAIRLANDALERAALNASGTLWRAEWQTYTTNAIQQHVIAADPHGDRAYADAATNGITGVFLASKGSITNDGIRINNIPLGNGSNLTITSGGGNVTSVNGATGVVVIATVASATNAVTVTGSQSNTLATALQPVSTQGLATVIQLTTATNALDLATISRDYPRSNPSNYITLVQVPAQTTQLYVAQAGAATALSAGSDSNRLAAALTNASAFDAAGTAAGLVADYLPLDGGEMGEDSQITGLLSLSFGPTFGPNRNSWTMAKGAGNALEFSYVNQGSWFLPFVSFGSAKTILATDGSGASLTGIVPLAGNVTRIGTLGGSNAVEQTDYPTLAQAQALAASKEVFFLTTNITTAVTNFIGDGTVVCLLSLTNPPTTLTRSVTYSGLNSYPIGWVYTNQIFSGTYAGGMSHLTLWCRESGAGSASHKPEFYFISTSGSNKYEYVETTLSRVVPAGATYVQQDWDIVATSTNLPEPCYGAIRLKVTDISGTPVVDFQTGNGTISHLEIDVPLGVQLQPVYDLIATKVDATPAGIAAAGGVTNGQVLAAAQYPLALTNAAAFDAAGTAGVVQANLTIHTNLTLTTGAHGGLSAATIAAAGGLTNNSFSINGVVVGNGSNAIVTALNGLTNNAFTIEGQPIGTGTNYVSSPFQAWTAILTPPASAGTTTLVFSNGTLPYLGCTGAQTIAWGPAGSGGWPSGGVNRQRLAFFPNSYTITIQSNASVTWATPITIVSTITNHIIAQICNTNVTLFQMSVK